ncbi:MAG TPA: bifunctional YncE family protein/alkaline phosphatase family protein [Gemmatimonadaceae bacterium]|nr:bifunctional YncE family protein/alkaline phosphatase family protein [Gemmatimonadaceae bacterium]
MISVLLLPLIQARVQQPPAPPRRAVPDSGVITFEQRVTPAGVQSVFNGRVAAVRFGLAPGEIWVAAPDGAYRLSYQENRVIASSRFDGTPGVHGIAIDPVARRALFSTVGRRPDDVMATIPGAQRQRAPSVSQVFAYDAASVTPRKTGGGDSAAVVFNVTRLGDYMSGGLAVARRANASGKRVIVAPLPANDKVEVLDAGTGARVSTIATGVLPVAAVVSDDGSEAWVSVYGGPKPKPGELQAPQQAGYRRAEPVRIDPRGIAREGSVVRIDLVAGRITDRVVVGRHPGAMAWDRAHDRLYVPNANSDSVSIVDTRARRRLGGFAIAPFRERKAGLSPTSVALSPDGTTLYVTLGGINAVAVYDVARAGNGSGATLRGLIPTGWYPSSIDVSADGSTIAVGTLLGVGSGEGTVSRLTSGNALAARGSVNVIPVPTEAELLAYTTSVGQNVRLHPVAGGGAPAPLAPRANVAARAVPERPGEPSLINHVVFIIRENRTYDQVLSDLDRGARDSTLLMYGRDVTPNAHALSEQFVTLDHFFATGGNSADGHQWLTQANETDYPMWPLYFGRSYPSESSDPLTYSSGGFLWEAAAAKNRTVTVFGEYAPPPSDSVPAVRHRMLDEYQDRATHDAAYFRAQLKKMYNTHSSVPSLDKVLVREYPGWTQETPDVVKADVVLEHLKEWEAARTMPNLVMVILPSDHTVGTSPGWTTPKANVADNDLALGRIVEGLSHSAFWKDMAILVVEDDAQNGVDHIDGHRTVALVASPYARRNVVDSTFYSQQGMVKTIELMLGLPSLSMFDLVATDMRNSFIGADERPDIAGYTAIVPRQSLHEYNPQPSEMRGPGAAARRAAAVASSRMDFDEPDAAPSDQLNRILWQDARGWGSKMPAVKRSVFFPLSVDLTDDEREERRERERERPRTP